MARRSWTSLAAVVLLLAACGGGSDPTESPAEAPTDAAASDAPASADTGGAGGACAPSTDPPTVTVEIRQRAFIPGRVEAAVGDVIVFENADSVPHTATLDDGSCTTENLGQGASGALTFSEAGEYPFFCRIHPDMTGRFVISG